MYDTAAKYEPCLVLVSCYGFLVCVLFLLVATCSSYLSLAIILMIAFWVYFINQTRHMFTAHLDI